MYHDICVCIFICQFFLGHAGTHKRNVHRSAIFRSHARGIEADSLLAHHQKEKNKGAILWQIDRDSISTISCVRLLKYV